MTTWTRAKPWKGNDLKGNWEATIKVDGVRAFWVDGAWVSRAGKPLYNIPPWPDNLRPPCHEGFEVYRHDPNKSSKENFKATLQAVRAKNKPERMLALGNLYRLDGTDKRLSLGYLSVYIHELHSTAFINPNAATIKAWLYHVVKAGFEGLVLRGPNGEWLKVKPEETWDVTVTGIIEGTGKHKGRMGALVTSRGKVGTGFDDKEREGWWAKATALASVIKGDLVWSIRGVHIIEVEAMGLTADGKFRHPRFVRIRDDKTETDDL